MTARLVALVSDPDATRRRDIGAALASSFDTKDVTLHALPDSLARWRADLVIVGVVDATTALDALHTLTRLHSADNRLPIILIVRESSEALAVAALRAGVSDYLCDPVPRDALESASRRLTQGLHPRTAHPPLRPDTSSSWTDCDPLIGSSPCMRAVCDYIDRLALTDATVLITGETGTGKELAARRLHDGSRRRGARFVPVNCAAIPDGLLESELFGYEAGAFTGAARTHDGLLQQADGGTIFLDEIGDLGTSSQAKILRAIETRQVHRLGGRRPSHVDVRVVAATNHDLERAVDEQRFRKDLYFRLNVARVHLPPLRERRSDIPAIIDHYLRTLGRADEVSIASMDPQTLEALVDYDWPGNVRELRNLVEGLLAVTPSGRIGIADLPPLFRARLARYCALPDEERKRIMDALFAADWNKSRAAEMLHWSRMTLYRKMARYSVTTFNPTRRSHTRPR